MGAVILNIFLVFQIYWQMGIIWCYYYIDKIIAIQGRDETMPEKGKKDKSQREDKKKAKLTIKEKRRQKKDKPDPGSKTVSY